MNSEYLVLYPIETSFFNLYKFFTFFQHIFASYFMNAAHLLKHDTLIHLIISGGGWRKSVGGGGQLGNRDDGES